MANVKISNLPDAGDIQPGDTVPIVRAGVTLRSTQNPTVTVSSMVGNAGRAISVNNSEDGYVFADFSETVIAFTWNRSGNTAVGNMLMLGALDEMLLAYDAELIAMSILRTDTDAATLEVLNNGSPIKELATSSVGVVDNFAGIACSALDAISVRNKAGGNTVSNCGVTLTFRLT